MDDFEAVFALVKLAASPEACERRLAELNAARDEITTAGAALAAAREAFEAERTDIEQQKDALRDREVKIAGAEALHQHHHRELVELAQEVNSRDTHAKRRV